MVRAVLARAYMDRRVSNSRNARKGTRCPCHDCAALRNESGKVEEVRCQRETPSNGSGIAW